MTFNDLQMFVPQAPYLSEPKIAPTRAHRSRISLRQPWV